MLINMYQHNRLRMTQEQKERDLRRQQAHPVVIIVDNDQAVLGLMEELLQAEGYTVYSFAGHDVQDVAIQHICPDLVILEAHPRYAHASVTLVRQLRRMDGLRTTPIMVNSTDRRLLESVTASLDNQSCYTFEKPFDIDFFLQSVRSVIGSRSKDRREKAPSSII